MRVANVVLVSMAPALVEPWRIAEMEDSRGHRWGVFERLDGTYEAHEEDGEMVMQVSMSSKYAGNRSDVVRG